MKPAEIRAMTNEQLEDRLTELHAEWQRLRFQEAIGKLTDTARIRQIRKDIARIHTIRRERELDEALRAKVASGR
ncbi:MAG TPA: 50S ribosomal protein L29 [Thermomicrobiales bacterium]|jgi:large subunit ribosomal protein L29